MDFDTWKLGDVYNEEDDTITCMLKASNGEHEYDIYLFADGTWEFVERIECEGYTVPHAKLSKEILKAIAKRDKEVDNYEN